MAERTWIHAFSDGRDVSPTSAEHDLGELPPDRIATVSGRYYAMDRDGRWDRTERALAAIVTGDGLHGSDPVAEVRRSYAEGVTDEFIEPVVLDGPPRLKEADAAVFFNFRPDRARQLSQKLLVAGYDLTTMTRYREDFEAPVAFDEQEVRGTIAEVLSRNGARQLHVAETEKYAHVTYFFNGGREEEGRGRRGFSSRRRGTWPPTTRSPRCRRRRSRSGSRRRSDRGTASASSTSPTPTWSGTRA